MIKLKQVLEAHALKQSALAIRLGISSAGVAQLVNHSIWPKRLQPDYLRGCVLTWLVEMGISPADLATVFEEVEPRRGSDGAQEQQQHNHPLEEGQPMLLRKQSLTPAAKRHFSLFRDPFGEEVQSHEDVFSSPDIRYVRESMFQTAKLGGFMAVCGESGAGKSTLRRDLIDRINRENQSIVVIEPYVLAAEDNDVKGKTLKSAHIADAILATIAPAENIKRSQEARFRQLHRVLRDSRRAGNSHALVIEEAHSLPIPTLKHLKRFYELEDGFQKLLSIILIGQPELCQKLSESSQEVREVVQRCEIVQLAPLDNHLQDYLAFKLQRVGKPLKDIIDAPAIDAMRGRLTMSTNRRDRRETTSLLYPLAVGNFMTSCMNLAADIGAPLVTADVVKEA